MFRRRPSVARTVARTAVVAGTATAVAGGVASRQAAGNAPAQPAEAAPPETTAAPPETEAAAPETEAAPAETAAAPSMDPIELLSKLGELRDRGVLTEEEFAAQKAKILAQL
jgi:Short C-terminal domain